MEEILELTRETLNELKGPAAASETSENLNDEIDPYAQEMAIFMAEINEDVGGPSKSVENLSDQLTSEMEKFKVILMLMTNVFK